MQTQQGMTVFLDFELIKGNMDDVFFTVTGREEQNALILR
jgi:hypothetical protein